jgi:hypothetical protein
MTLENISRKLNCVEYYKNTGYSRIPVEHVTATDLMSEVLIAEEEHMLLITALNTEQTLRTAHIVDAAGVLLVNSKKPQPAMVRLAEEFDLALISTVFSTFESCVGVHSMKNKENE